MENEIQTARINQVLNDFGGLIHEYRLKNNLPLNVMAEIIGFSPSYVWRIENNKRIPGLKAKLEILIAIWSIEDVHKYLLEILKEENKVI